MEETKTDFEAAIMRYLEEQKKLNDEFIDKFKETGIPVLPPAREAFLNRLAAGYGLKRRFLETDRHFRKRINEYVAYLEKENREKTLKETYDVFYPAPWQTE